MLPPVTNLLTIPGSVFAVDRGKSHDATTPATHNERAGRFPDGKRHAAEEVGAVDPLSFQTHLIIHLGKIFLPGDSGAAIADGDDHVSLFNQDLATGPEFRWLPALHRFAVEQGLPFDLGFIGGLRRSRFLLCGFLGQNKLGTDKHPSEEQQTNSS